MPDHPLTRRLYAELGVRVRRRREALEMRQEDLARDVGVSRSSIANIERGQQHAPVHVLLGLAEALRVDMAALLPTHAELLAAEQVASREVPKMVSIGGESGLMTPEVMHLVGSLLSQSREPSAHPGVQKVARHSEPASPPEADTGASASDRDSKGE